MRDTLRAGIEGTFRYRVTDSKTVPRIYEEAADFQNFVTNLKTAKVASGG